MFTGAILRDAAFGGSSQDEVVALVFRGFQTFHFGRYARLEQVPKKLTDFFDENML